jgi:RNA ligase
MKLFDYIDQSEFEYGVVAGYINVNYHPTEEGLRIICYSQTCNAEKYWNDTTKKCRGLIVDKDDNIISRPFEKFFNLEEYDDLTVIDGYAADFGWEIYEKLDGSLGILYWIGDTPYIATKGSFTSQQALHATHLLHTKYRHTWSHLLRSKTYLFEIIYPGDLHIVKYNNVDDIFLLAVISTENFFEYPAAVFKDLFPVAKKYYCDNWKEARNIFDGTNREGFVIKFGPVRVKMKYEEYWRLHYLKSGLSEKMIRKCLADGDMSPIAEALTLCDEEQVIFYNDLIKKYTDKYAEIMDRCVEDYRTDFETKKDAALYFKTCKYQHILFAMYNGYNPAEMTWKYVFRELE